MLSRTEGLDADIAAVDAQIEEQLAPFAEAAAHLDEIPGIGPVAAAAIIAESGRTAALLLKNNPGVRWGLWSRFPCWTWGFPCSGVSWPF